MKNVISLHINPENLHFPLTQDRISETKYPDKFHYGTILIIWHCYEPRVLYHSVPPVMLQQFNAVNIPGIPWLWRDAVFVTEGKRNWNTVKCLTALQHVYLDEQVDSRIYYLLDFCTGVTFTFSYFRKGKLGHFYFENGSFPNFILLLILFDLFSELLFVFLLSIFFYFFSYLFSSRLICSLNFS